MAGPCAAALLALSLFACTDDVTQIVVSVHTDLEAVSVIAVDVDATRAGGGTRRFEERLSGPGSIRLPATLAIVSRGSSAESIDVVASAVRDGAVVLSRAATVRFVPGESRTLSLDLLSCCLGVVCGDSQSCGQNGCVDTAVDERALPSWTGTAPAVSSCGAQDAGSPEAGADGGPDGGLGDAGGDSGRPDDCEPRRPPPRPAGPDDGAGGVRWYAVRSVDSGDGDPARWPEIAWDLDGLCTDLDSSELACEPAPGFGPPADGRDGVDNVFAQSLVGLFSLFEPTFFAQVNEELERGRVGFLLRVAGWNGLPDDPQVDVALVDAVAGLRADTVPTDGGLPDMGTPSPDGGAPPRALAWDGTDYWYADVGSFAAGNPEQPLNRDRSGYVRGGLLVARAASARIVVSAIDRSLPLRLGNGTLITGRLSGDGARLEGGIVAGTWAVDDILDSFVHGLGICGPDCICTGPAYESLVATLEHVSDLNVDPDPGLDVRCDAVSVGMGFEAFSARLGGLGPAAETLTCVADAGVTP